MRGAPPTRDDDLFALRLLDLRDNTGLSAKEIGDRVDLTRNAVLGRFHRLKHDDVECQCRKPENRDGGTPRRWWA